MIVNFVLVKEMRLLYKYKITGYSWNTIPEKSKWVKLFKFFSLFPNYQKNDFDNSINLKYV
jgi:hypothetical protein